MSSAPEDTQLLYEARLLESEGRLPEAIRCYLSVLSRRPEQAKLWCGLARLQRAAGSPAEALVSYEQALGRGLNRPEEAHLSRAGIFADDLRQPEAAEQELALALRINPTYVPALLKLANLHEDLGRTEAARQSYGRILELNPRCHEALARHAHLVPITTAEDPRIARLRAALEDGRAMPGERASAGFALGRALDACGAYAQAFDAYSRAHRASRDSAPVGTAPYDPAAWERLVDRAIAAFPDRGPEPPAADVFPEPIFICGMVRSGVALIERLLVSHPQITAGGEVSPLTRIAPHVLNSFADTIDSAPPAVLQKAAEHYREALARSHRDAQLVTDARPDHVERIGLIKRLLPRARIVHTVRHPLDNCLSIYFRPPDPRMTCAHDLEHIGHYYRHCRRLMAHWQRLYGADLFELRYDTLVREPRQVLGALLGFLRVGWHEGCLQAITWDQRSSGRWRHYAAQLTGARAALGEALQERSSD